MRNVNEEWGEKNIEGMEVWKEKEVGSKREGKEKEGKHQVLLKKDTKYKMKEIKL